MSLTVKVTITEAWNEDGKGWVAEVKDFGLTANAKTFEKAIEQIQPKIEAYLQQMFGTEKRVVASVGAATAKVEFEIDVQKDRKLEEFDAGAALQKTCDIVNSGALDTPGCTITASVSKSKKKKKGAALDTAMLQEGGA